MAPLNFAMDSSTESPELKNEYIAKETINSHITKIVDLMYLSICDPKRIHVGVFVQNVLYRRQSLTLDFTF
jgi:hypothetical protein